MCQFGLLFIWARIHSNTRGGEEDGNHCMCLCRITSTKAWQTRKLWTLPADCRGAEGWRLMSPRFTVGVSLTLNWLWWRATTCFADSFKKKKSTTSVYSTALCSIRMDLILVGHSKHHLGACACYMGLEIWDSSLFSFSCTDVRGLSWFHSEQWYHWEDMCNSFLHFV